MPSAPYLIEVLAGMVRVSHPIMSIVFAMGLCMTSAAPVSAQELIVYLSQDGRDDATGLARNAPVASIQAAVDLVLRHQDAAYRQYRILVLPGTYLGQRVTVAGLLGKPVVISPESDAADRPVFDGNGQGGTWLVLKASNGLPTKLTISGLEIRNYVTAISFNGNRLRVEISNGSNVIRDNVFRNIGQIAFPEGALSTAALRLVNSNNNEISGNSFVNIRNIFGCSALHAIYMAHHSSNNRVFRNTFDGGCGATIKVRDSSNHNIVSENSFLDQSAQVFLESYCNRDTRDDCTKKSPECPSEGNTFSDNVIATSDKSRLKKWIESTGADRPSGCTEIKDGHLRVHEKRNVFK